MNLPIYNPPSNQVSYFTLLTRYNISNNEIFKNFYYNQFTHNLNFLLDNIDNIKEQNISEKDKTILYHILNDSDESMRETLNSELHPNHKDFKKVFLKIVQPIDNEHYFASSLIYLAINKHENEVLNVLTYFLNQYYIAIENAIGKTKTQSIIDEPSVLEKLNLCTKTQTLFLPYQNKEVSHWTMAYRIKKEQEYLESQFNEVIDIKPTNKKIKI